MGFVYYLLWLQFCSYYDKSGMLFIRTLSVVFRDCILLLICEFLNDVCDLIWNSDCVLQWLCFYFSLLVCVVGSKPHFIDWMRCWMHFESSVSIHPRFIYHAWVLLPRKVPGFVNVWVSLCLPLSLKGFGSVSLHAYVFCLGSHLWKNAFWMWQRSDLFYLPFIY